MQKQKSLRFFCGLARAWAYLALLLDSIYLNDLLNRIDEEIVLEILVRDAMMQPHRTVIDRHQLEQGQLAQLTTALRQQMLKKIRENKDKESINCRLSDGSPGVSCFHSPLKNRLQLLKRFPNRRISAIRTMFLALTET